MATFTVEGADPKTGREFVVSIDAPNQDLAQFLQDRYPQYKK